MRFVFLIYFVLTGVVFAQTPDTVLQSDQNPNYKKSKEKYTKPVNTNTVNIYTVDPIDTTSKPTTGSSTVTAVTQNPELDLYIKNLKTAEQQNDADAKAKALSALGNYYYKNNDLNKALNYYQESLALNESRKNKKAALENINLIALVFYKLNNMPKAEEYYQKALTGARTLNDPNKVKQATDALSRIYARSGNYKNAYEMSLLLKQVTDSLNKNEIRQKLLQNKLSYDSLQEVENAQRYAERLGQKQLEVESSRKTIYLVVIGLVLALVLAVTFYLNYRSTQKVNKIIEQQKIAAEEKKEIIETSLAEKETLLKEIHHRVKNNLQIISSLLNLQSKRSNDENIKQVMSEATNRISSMSIIHQKLYQSGNLSSVDFQAYLEEMTKSIEATFNTEKKEIAFDIDTHNLKLDIDTSIPLGLIINELITNSFKYAFKGLDKGRITVILSKINEQELQLHVHDNGNGLPPGFDVNGLKSLGIKLVKGLAGQLKGTLNYETNQGAHWYINFKNPSVT